LISVEVLLTDSDVFFGICFYRCHVSLTINYHGLNKTRLMMDHGRYDGSSRCKLIPSQSHHSNNNFQPTIVYVIEDGKLWKEKKEKWKLIITTDWNWDLGGARVPRDVSDLNSR
jgi:hypothetical protein